MAKTVFTLRTCLMAPSRHVHISDDTQIPDISVCTYFNGYTVVKSGITRNTCVACMVPIHCNCNFFGFIFSEHRENKLRKWYM